jgi:hypothetical protein
MTKGGLYIPLPEHIEIYCSTTHFIQCHQYIRGKEILREAAAAEGIFDDSRRRHRRIKEQLPISIVACDSMGKLKGEKAEETSTMDLSIGGLCLTSTRERPTNELLLLKLMPDKSDSILTGIGEVRWCNAISESSDYRVGIAFKTKETSWAVGIYLDLSVA